MRWFMISSWLRSPKPSPIGRRLQATRRLAGFQNSRASISITVASQPYVIQITLAFRRADSLNTLAHWTEVGATPKLSVTSGKHKKAGALSLRLMDSTAIPRRRVGPRVSFCGASLQARPEDLCQAVPSCRAQVWWGWGCPRSEEHTSELQSLR